ncbi:hypothetical protein AK830_g4146 [Neonectria ditissima]|uniref:BZIP domain-containing protein n=1 Tax=Neonectria ditissima TaxID=78410 RepID=A0A0P7BNN5_9HYPO|nr:hypothetical protein AK830_g4146 [Neonectria ditissima]
MSDGSAAVATSVGRPRTRQRAYKEPPSLPVPHIEEDAAERKRVLNVLAQRRYREKKRLNRLKAAGKDEVKEAENTATQTQEPSPSSSSDNQVEDSVHVAATPSEIIVPSLAPTPSIMAGLDLGTESQLDEIVDEVVTTSDFAISTLAPTSGIIAGLDMGLSQWDPLGDMSFPSLLPQLMMPDDLHGENIVQQPESSATPSISEDASLTIDPSKLDTSPMPSSDIDFTDSYHLPMLELSLAMAVARIADRLGSGQGIWDLECTSVFNTGNGTPANQLPVAWRPTRTQIVLPHHPLFDFLPWPRVRDRIINIMALPDDQRPPNAKGPLALVNFAYDIEDSAEGVRIYGEDPCEPGSWEVGQVMFERWWYLFDREIIANSNRWRRLRGAPPLRLKGSNLLL